MKMPSSHTDPLHEPGRAGLPAGQDALPRVPGLTTIRDSKDRQQSSGVIQRAKTAGQASCLPVAAASSRVFDCAQHAHRTGRKDTCPAAAQFKRWIGRALIVAAGLVVWFWTQSLIGHRPSGVGIVDQIHQFTQSANDYLQAHPRSANSLLIASSMVIDSLGIFLIGATIFGKTLRPFAALLIVFGLRQICQWLCALPPPPQMIWRDPGFPSLLVTYGVSNDLFFSGHTAIAVLGGIELYRLRPLPWTLAASVAIALFEMSVVLVLRAHYTMDVVTGAMAAILAAIAANVLCRRFSSNLKTESALTKSHSGES